MKSGRIRSLKAVMNDKNDIQVLYEVREKDA